MEVVGIKIVADKPLRQLLQGWGKFFFTMTAALTGSSGPISNERTVAWLAAFRSLTQRAVTGVHSASRTLADPGGHRLQYSSGAGRRGL